MYQVNNYKEGRFDYESYIKETKSRLITVIYNVQLAQYTVINKAKSDPRPHMGKVFKDLSEISAKYKTLCDLPEAVLLNNIDSRGNA